MNCIKEFMNHYGLKFDEEFVAVFGRSYLCKIDKDYIILSRDVAGKFVYDLCVLGLIMRGKCEIILNRFKPEEGDSYYRIALTSIQDLSTESSVGPVICEDKDEFCIRVGNCFRTEAAANEKLAKIRSKGFEHFVKEIFKDED